MHTARLHLQGIVRLLAVLAVLTAGYAGMRLAPTLHATASHVVPHTQLAIECPSATAHC
jgi:hypothetical protein